MGDDSAIMQQGLWDAMNQRRYVRRWDGETEAKSLKKFQEAYWNLGRLCDYLGFLNESVYLKATQPLFLE